MVCLVIRIKMRFWSNSLSGSKPFTEPAALAFNGNLLIDQGYTASDEASMGSGPATFTFSPTGLPINESIVFYVYGNIENNAITASNFKVNGVTVTGGTFTPGVNTGGGGTHYICTLGGLTFPLVNPVIEFQQLSADNQSRIDWY